MISIRSVRGRLFAALGAAALVAAVVPLPHDAIHADVAGSSSVVCTQNATSSFVLTALDGEILTPDGNTVYMWSYAPGGGAFQYPGPMLCVTSGQQVTITLQNQLAVPTSIVFEGIEGVLADGAPASVQTDVGGRVVSLVQSAASGGSVTYTFEAPPPGTYLYHSGTDPQLQREMGLAGALIVRPATFDNGADANRTVYDDGAADDSGSFDSSFAPSQEYVHLLSQVDPSIHLAVEKDESYDFASYRPRYFMINGRSFPDTVAPNGASWLPSQPYSSLVHVHAIGQGQDLPSVVRYLNASTIAVPFHPHSNHEEVVGIDARPLVNPDDSSGFSAATVDQFAIDVQPGQTIDARFAWTNVTWGDGGISAPAVPDQRNLQNGAYWSGEVLLGDEGVRPAGGDDFNQCGEFYHVAHNHALYGATNYGAAMGGQLTLVRIDPDNSGC